MKKILLILSILISSVAVAQKHNIVNASISLKHAKNAKDGNVEIHLKEAKQFIDNAYSNEGTANEPKMWNYRAPIYLEIALKSPDVDTEAILKATEAYLNCLKTDHKDRIIVRKWTQKEDILSGLVQCAYNLFNQGIEEYNLGNYKKALKLYSAIFNIIPFDEADQLKRGNITKETVLFNSYYASNKIKDNAKSKEILQELINLNFNEPTIYIYMSNIYLEEDNVDKAIEYLSLGREMFEDDQSLINTEINLYIQLERTTELINKLGEAIKFDPDNDLLYFNRGTIFDQEGDILNAENDYLKALELNPSSFGANYNLGALFFNFGVKLKDLASNASTDKLYKSYMKQAYENFDKALPYMEDAFSIDDKDKNTIISLKQLYALKGHYDKSNDMKELLNNLK